MSRSAIVLAGGRSARMGRDKGKLVLRGRSLVAHAVAACRDRGGCDHVVVVAPHLPDDLPPGSALLALEHPPFGGPVAGLAAGLAALPPAQPDGEVLVLACDLPRVAEIVSLLTTAELGTDGTCLVDSGDVPQYLAGRYCRRSLTSALPAEVDGAALKSTLSGLRLRLVPAPGLTSDVDTPAQADAFGVRLD
ncbi:molybdenum cofactor guanylyltransferase [Micropruina sp.]|uniref:molybdenum cofactor guanylyltransferase n=1 Tax=Micropruina sp. TaxID=2737536 RepID=UPI0039E226C1